MNYDYQEVKNALSAGAAGAIRAWEAQQKQILRDTAEAIIANREKSPVVLLAGPSGSGKTTTGHRLAKEIQEQGVRTHLISMDNYFVPRNTPGFPRLPNGEPDLESPYCMDIPLLNRHFGMLETGEDISVPYYDFYTKDRDPQKETVLDGSKGDIFLFEGIHALNPLFTDQHPHAFRLYVSPEKGIELDGAVLLTPAHLRLMRRVVRDAAFRGASPSYSLRLWVNVVESEVKNVSAYKHTAHVTINTTLAYEAGVMKPFALKAFSDLEQDVPCMDMVEQVLFALKHIDEVPAELVPEESILREFIG